jgi:hypothetical protein
MAKNIFMKQESLKSKEALIDSIKRLKEQIDFIEKNT